MKNLKVLLLSLLLVYFVQETGTLYLVALESLAEYANEKSESREEFVFNHAAKSVVKNTHNKKERLFTFILSENYHTLPKFNTTVKLNILYRSLLI